MQGVTHVHNQAEFCQVINHCTIVSRCHLWFSWLGTSSVAPVAFCMAPTGMLDKAQGWLPLDLLV